MTAAPVRDREYDRFGPWVLEISDDDPLPRLFVPHVTRSEEPLLSIKVPRRIARRDAHPGMDLYDYVVSLYEHDLVLLERIGRDVRARAIDYGDVRHLVVHEELLRGGLHLCLERDPYTLPYNTVSNDVMRRVAEIVRERYLPTDAPVLERPAAGDVGELSFYFERLLKEERTNHPEVRPAAAQATVSLGATETNLTRRFLFGLLGKRLLESLHLSDGRELRVIDRGRSFAYRWQAVYGRRETIIPLANITGVELTSGADGVATLTVATAGGRSSWPFLERAPDLPGYVEWLERTTATRR